MLLRNKDAELSPWSGNNATVFIQEPSWGGTGHLLNETMSEAGFQVHKAIVFQRNEVSVPILTPGVPSCARKTRGVWGKPSCRCHDPYGYRGDA